MSHGTASSPSLRAKRHRGRRWNTAAVRARRRRVGVGEETSRRHRLRAPRVDSLHCEVEEEQAEASVVRDLLGAASINGELNKKSRRALKSVRNLFLIFFLRMGGATGARINRDELYLVSVYLADKETI